MTVKLTQKSTGRFTLGLNEDAAFGYARCEWFNDDHAAAWMAMRSGDLEFRDYLEFPDIENKHRGNYRDTTDIREALVMAYNLIPDGCPRVRNTIGCILAQRGCEDYDTGVEDSGYMTDLMSVIMFG